MSHSTHWGFSAPPPFTLFPSAVRAPTSDSTIIGKEGVPSFSKAPALLPSVAFGVGNVVRSLASCLSRKPGRLSRCIWEGGRVAFFASFAVGVGSSDFVTAVARPSPLLGESPLRL